MTNDSGVRAVIYCLKADLDFAAFDRDVHSMEARHLGTWAEFTPAGFVVAEDGALSAEGDDHVLLMPTGEKLTARQVMAGDGVGLGVTVLRLLPHDSG